MHFHKPSILVESLRIAWKHMDSWSGLQFTGARGLWVRDCIKSDSWLLEAKRSLRESPLTGSTTCIRHKSLAGVSRRKYRCDARVCIRRSLATFCTGSLKLSIPLSYQPQDLAHVTAVFPAGGSSIGSVRGPVMGGSRFTR